jgi:flagellar basal-body rod protein FlgF
MPSVNKVAASMNALVREYETITQNLANASSTGYKKKVNTFASVLGELKAQTKLDFSQGNLEQTQRPLDLAISGDGFFTVETPEGVGYTRNGILEINNQRQLVDSQGRMMIGMAGPIVIPQHISRMQLNFAPDGTISGTDGLRIDRLAVVDFGEDIEKLTATGGGTFAAPEDLDPEPALKAFVQQGFRESSNVETVDELVKLITVSRLYEANVKILSKNTDTSKHILDVAMG